MKKLIITLLVGVASTNIYAQNNTVMPLTAGDTIVNAGTVTKTMPAVSGGYNVIAYQPVVTRVAGTAAGTGVLYKTLDGINYKSTGDTIQLANAAINSIIIEKVAPGAVSYRWVFTGSGSQVSIVRFNYIYRKFQTY